MINKNVLVLDLVDDEPLISEYEDYHKNVWPEVTKNFQDNDVKKLEIYRYKTRLVMIMEVGENFSFDKMKTSDRENIKVQEWEKIMGKYQKSLHGSSPDEKWQLMQQIFSLDGD